MKMSMCICCIKFTYFFVVFNSPDARSLLLLPQDALHTADVPSVLRPPLVTKLASYF